MKKLLVILALGLLLIPTLAMSGTFKDEEGKFGLKKVTTLQFWYIVVFVIAACISTYLYDLNIEPTYSWLPFLIGIVGFIHVKYFHKL